MLDQHDGGAPAARLPAGLGAAGDAGMVGRRRLSDQVATALKDRIVAARLPTGSQLPTEMELAQEYGVSRTVVREANRILLEWGLVDIRPGRGMIVADYDGSTLARQYELMVEMTPGGFSQLMEMRLTLEVAIARHAALRRTESDIARIRASVADLGSEAVERGARLEADLGFHLAVAHATQNPFYPPAIDPVNSVLLRTYSSSRGYGDALRQTIEEHRAIADAIAVGDADAAAGAMTSHLLRVRDDGAVLADTHPSDAPGGGA